MKIKLNINSPEQFIQNYPIENLNLEQAKQIYDKLVEDLNIHNYLYYVKSQPVISDYEYDLLFHYLEKLEKKFPQLIRKDSPTQRLTNQVQDELKKAKHKYPLLSLENTYSETDVKEKLEKYENDYGIDKFYIEPKYDGLSLEIIYENGYFKQAITRGDGYKGEDVTESAKTINTLPLKIAYKGKLHVRGEVVVRKSIFEKINKEQEKKGLETYSNPRNFASGSLRQLDPSITRQRHLDLICYEVLNFSELDPKLEFHHKSLNFLEKNGFWVFDFKTLGIFTERKFLDKEKILEVVKSENIKNLLDEQDVEFDGLVIKVDEEKFWNVLGNTAHHPRWAFAFKYPAKQITTKIIDMEFSVGRTGIITPVAILEPVNIGGVIVKRASLHNFDFIKEKDIRIGDYVLVQRSGEVIPYIVSVIKERRQGDLPKIEEPKYCPVCGAKTVHLEGEVALRCINVACPAQVLGKIAYFVSKDGLDIEGLSEKTIELLLKAKLIQDYADIFTLPEKRIELLALPGFQEKKVENLILAIESKKNIELNILLQALGIEYVGKKTAKIIVENIMLLNKFNDFLTEKKYVDFKKFIDFLLSKEGEEFLLSINGIGPKVVQSIQKFFQEEHNKKVIDKLLKHIKVKITKFNQGKFSGQEFVITGSIPGIPREEIAKFIEENGGEFSNEVTKHTTLLLVGEKPGHTKLEKAKEYNIPTYSLLKFLKENNFNFPKNLIQEESLF